MSIQPEWVVLCPWFSWGARPLSESSVIVCRGGGFRRCMVVVVIGLLWWLFRPFPAFAATITAAAASSLRPVLERVRQDYRQHVRDAEVRLVYAASGTLVQQIRHGAPYALFFSAAPEFLRPLERDGRICEGPVVIGEGYLVLYVPKGAKVPLDASLMGLKRLPPRHLAIADPAVAPFGRVARHALEKAGVWQPLQRRVVYGESAAQAAQMALSGAVDAALLPRHLVQSAPFGQRGRWVAVERSLYRPMPLTMVLLCGATAAEHAFYTFVRDRLAGREAGGTGTGPR